MSFWQIPVLIAVAGCTIGCLFGILRSIEKLTKCLFSISVELRNLNAKLESVEAVDAGDSHEPADQGKSDLEALEAIEAAISNFESLKRVDLPNPPENE